MSDDETSADRSSPPALPPESPGSSLSVCMQDDYTELLKFAIASGLEDQQVAKAEAGTQELDAAFTPIVTHVSSPRQEQTEEDDGEEHPRTPVNVDVFGNTNSNNIHHNSSNESPEVPSLNINTNSSNQPKESYMSLSSATLGPDVNKMGDKLDGWLGTLKGDILAELSRVILVSLQSQRKEHEKEIIDLVAEKQRLEREATRLGEQVCASEQSLARKDTLVENLTQALNTSKEKVQVAKVFYATRADAADQRRLCFTEKLAIRHHEKQLMQRVLHGWFGLIQTRWRNRVQKGCEEHARDVCARLSQDYEDKIRSLNLTIENLRQKVAFLQQERGQYAEQVRKAFMRGVCALNMETMSAFGPEENLDLDPATGHSHPRTVATGPATYQEDSSEEQDYSHNAVPHPTSMQELSKGSRETDKEVSFQQQHPNQPRSLPLCETGYTSGVLECGTVGLQPRSLQPHKTKVKSSKVKGRVTSATGSTSSTRHTTRSASVTNQGQPLAPPMASISVERHNPVTKQTLGKATAVRYPKSALGQVSKSQPSSLIGQTFKPLAGQTTSLTNMASIKVVD